MKLAPSKTIPGRTPPVKTVVYNNFSMRVYSIAWLQYLTNRKSFTLRQWERDGILPKPILSLGDNMRWYTAAEILGYTNIVQECNKGKKMPSIKSVGLVPKLRAFNLELRTKVKNNPCHFLAKLPQEEMLRKMLLQHRGLALVATLT